MTVAEQIEAQFRKPGAKTQPWSDPNGNELIDVIFGFKPKVEKVDNNPTKVTYHFDDGSKIVVTGDWWNVG